MILADIEEIVAIKDITIIVDSGLSWDQARRTAIKAGKVLLAQFLREQTIEVQYQRGGETRSIIVR